MAKKGKKAVTGKKAAALEALAEFKRCYSAACKLRSIRPDPKLIEDIDARLEDGKTLDLMSFQGPGMDAEHVQVLFGLLQTYYGCRSVGFFGCKLGEDGLAAVSQLLMASVGPWYAGSKLLHLEITADCTHDRDASSWPQAHREYVLRNTASFGRGLQMASLVMGDAEAVVPLGGYTATQRVRCFETPQESEADVPSSLALFARAIGSRGVTLQILVLDHHLITAAAMAALRSGLKRCMTLKELSLAYCGLTLTAVASLADALALDPLPQLAVHQPQLRYLNVQGNPLGGEGLVHIAAALPSIPSLTSLGLADIQVTEQHQSPIADFIAALGASPSLSRIDFGFNQIGDVQAELFLTFLSNAPHVVELRLTPRIDRKLAAALYTTIRENIKAAKKRKKKKTSAASARRTGPARRSTGPPGAG